MNAEILHQDIQTLLEFFAKNCYRASDSKSSSESFFVSIKWNCVNSNLLSVTWRSSSDVEYFDTQKSEIVLAEGAASSF